MFKFVVVTKNSIGIDNDTNPLHWLYFEYMTNNQYYKYDLDGQYWKNKKNNLFIF